MASITLVSARPDRHRRPLRWTLCSLLLLATAGIARASDNHSFTVRNAGTRLAHSVYLLNADVSYQLTDTALDALANGVPLTIVLDIEVERERHWWLNATVAELEQRYQIYYHALSDQYLVSNVNGGALYTFHTLASALHALGRVRDLPLLDQNLVEPGKKYDVSLRARLDIESLPSPLRPLAYITPEWRLKSDWYTWSLTH